MPQGFAVIAEFDVKAERRDAFLALAREDAASSVRDEPGCRQFNVMSVGGEDGRVVFYEVYDSREAFDKHLETPHLQRFRDGFPELIIGELPVRFLNVTFAAGEGGKIS